MYTDSWRAKLFVLMSICPLCGVLGYLTPSLIDQYSAGQPAKAGKAYGINIVGCVLGPLLASYVLMPFMRERYALIALGAAVVLLFWFAAKDLSAKQRRLLVPVEHCRAACGRFSARATSTGFWRATNRTPKSGGITPPRSIPLGTD